MTGEEPALELAAMELFEQAMDRPADLREEYINDQSGADEVVRKRALKLLEADRQGLDSLRTGGAANLDEEDDDNHPEQIGAYRILRLLGRGGMGAVYMGERASDDFEHVVAIKRIKPGLLSETLKERFLRERQILAQLNHRHIARLYDGGETDDGAPYIVMEYINGISLSEWLEKKTPNLKSRLDLFMQICDAVEFAHQNLIIHRDLTPSNVLVSEGEQVKLIDFGIARPQIDDDDGSNLSTFTGMSLTPGFAAPERSKGAAANTLSDVFSLGRILALLTENYREDELDAIAARACATDPNNRYTTAGSLREDLERYRTGYPVSAMKGGVSYQFTKFVSRQKLAVALGSLTALALCGGLVGTYIQYSKADQRFNDVRTLANTMMFDIYDEIASVPGGSGAEIKLAEAAQKYLDDLAAETSVDPELKLEAARGFRRLSIIQGSPSSGARKRIKEAKANLVSAEKLLVPLLAADPQNEDVRYELNRVYYSIADMAIFNDLNVPAAFPAIRKAIVILEEAKDYGPLSVKLQTALISSKSMLSLAYGQNAQHDKALEIANGVSQDNLDLARANPEDRAIQRQVAISLNNLGRQLVNTERFADARKLYSEAVDVMGSLLKQAPNNDLYQRDMAYTLWRRAIANSKLKDGKSSLEDFDEAVRIMTGLVRKDPDDSNYLSFRNAIRGESMLAYKHLGQYAAAEKIGRQYIRDSQDFSKKHPDDKIAISDTLVAYQNLIGLFDESRQFDKMCQMMTRARAHLDVMEKAGILTELEKQRSRGTEEQKKRCSA